MNENRNLKKGVGIHARRFIAYVVLAIVSVLCLFWFYVLFINATRSNGEMQSGFTLVPSSHLWENWKNLRNGTLPVWNGMFNSLIISACSAVLGVYFSTMTAYAIHAYDFKLKKYIYPFILMIMMIPTQVTALGFIKLVSGMHLEDSFIPLIVPTIAAPVTFFYMKQYMESTLPLSLVEAARIILPIVMCLFICHRQLEDGRLRWIIRVCILDIRAQTNDHSIDEMEGFSRTMRSVILIVFVQFHSEVTIHLSL